MAAVMFNLLLFLSIVTLIHSDYLCNCYCPTSSTYVGYGTYTSSSTVCNSQNCANACVGAFSACTSGSTWGSCRNAALSLKFPIIISFMLGLTTTFIRRLI